MRFTSPLRFRGPQYGLVAHSHAVYAGTRGFVVRLSKKPAGMNAYSTELQALFHGPCTSAVRNIVMHGRCDHQ